MSDEYTPTTEQVRDGFATDPIAEYYDPITNHTAYRRRAFDRWLAAHDREVATKALEDARVRPEFTYYLPSDGEFEYTSSSDCDGSNVKYWRRLPKYVGSIPPWEPATEEQYRAAEIREETTDGSA